MQSPEQIRPAPASPLYAHTITEPAADIRHITSLPTLATPPSRKATSIHRMGSLSPASIPSSPTSVHSSSSAIFERDIEPLPAGSASMHLHPHRTPRGKQSEAVDAAVPSVLTTAANALVSLSPAPSAPASPATSHAGLAENDPFVVIAPTAQLLSTTASPHTSPSGRASPAREQSPRRRTSTAASISGLSGSPPLLPSPRLGATVSSSPPSMAAPLPVSSAEATTGPSANRLSFISYNDLLLSAPVSAVPLQSIVQPTSADAPPHLPAVQAAASITHSPARSRPRSMVGPGNRASMLLLDDAGGEWEREGLGRGLEERLEELLKREQNVQPQSA